MESLNITSSSMGQYIVDSMVETQTSIALIEYESRKSVSYGELRERIVKLANNLSSKCNVHLGEIVLVMLPNCLEFPICWYGVVYAGAIVVPIGMDTTENELQRTLTLMSPVCFIIHSDRLDVATWLQNNLTSCKNLFIVGKETTAFPSLDNLLQPCEMINCFSVCLEDTATIAFSSGTTELPKGVILTHKAVISSVEIMREKAYDPPEANEFILCPLSLIYGYPQQSILHLAMKEHATVVLMKKYCVESVLKAIDEFQVKQLHIVPVIGSTLVSTNIMDRHSLTSLKVIMNSGSSLLPELEINLLLTFPHVTYLRQAYGMTECAPATISVKDYSKIGSVGQPAKFMELKLVDLNTGKRCKFYQVGEVYIRGPTMMKGYLNNSSATKQVMTTDGWLKTGDLGYFDEQRNLFIVDRIKELIKYKSRQIAPAELENVLLQHPAIVEAAVIGIPRKEVGEVPRAYVRLKPGIHLTSEEVHKFTKDKVAPYKWFRGGIRVVDKLPHTSSGKIKRKLIKQQALQEPLEKNEWCGNF